MAKLLVIGQGVDSICKILDNLHMPYTKENDVREINDVDILFIEEEQYLRDYEGLETFFKPVIVVSKYMDADRIEHLYSLGMDDFILSPVSERSVKIKIQMWQKQDRESHKQQVGMWVYDMINETLIWDDQMYHMHHLNESIANLKAWKNLICKEDESLFEYVLEQIQHKVPNFNITYKLKDSDVFIEASGFVIEANEKPTKIMGMCKAGELSFEERLQDKQVEALLRTYKEKKDYLEKTLDIANVGHWEWHVKDDYSYETEQWFNMLGYSRKTFDFNDEFFYGLMHPSDLKHMVKVLDDIAAGRIHEIDEEFRLRHADGSWVWIMDKGKVLKYDTDGKAILASGVHIDITEKKNTMRENELLSHAVKRSPIGIVITDNVGQIEYVNPAYEEMTGYNQEEIIGKKANVTTSGYHNQEFYDELWSELYSGNQWKGSFYNMRKDGSFYWESAVISPLFDNNDQITSFIALKEDITVQKIKEQAIVERNKRLTRQQWIMQSLTQNKNLSLMVLEDVFDMINEAIVSGLDIDACAICMFEEMNTNLKVASRVSQYNEKPIHQVYLLGETRATFSALLNGEHVTINDSYESEFETMQEFLREEGTLSSIHVPIYYEQEVVGCIRGESKANARLWPEDEISFLKAISNYLNIILETRERLKAQENAEDAARAKAAFLANMSHEIRTPMNAVIGLAKVALDNAESRKQKDQLIKINSAANHLLVLINDILDYSKVEAGRMTIEHLPFNLEGVMSNLESMVSSKAAEKNLPFSIELANGLPIHLIGDPHRLHQILLNLASNAIKFTDKGFVHLKVERVYSDANNDDYIMLQFSVKDTGIGMSEASVNQLFESFQQADTTISRKFGGTGLGLSISKELAKLFGGKIEVVSELGIGSTFSFTANFEVGDDNYEFAETFKTLKTTNEDQSKIIVVVEDEISKEIIEGYLSPEGMTPLFMSSGQALLDYLDGGETCGLILIDMHLSGLNGYDTSYIIRSNTLFDYIPIIAISADPRPTTRMKTFNHGMNDFIVKPFDKTEMIAMVLKWLSNPPMDLKIENVDTDLGLRRFNNNKELYLNILRQFTVEHISDVELIRHAIQNKSGEERKLLKTLKGFAGHIGSIYLEQEIFAIEDFVLNRKRGYKQKLEQLEEVLKLIMNNIKKALNDYQGIEEVVIETDMSEIKDGLIALSTPLQNGNITEIKNIMRILDDYQIGESAKGLYQNMALKIKRYQYDEAEKALQSLLKVLEGEDEHHINS